MTGHSSSGFGSAGVVIEECIFSTRFLPLGFLGNVTVEISALQRWTKKFHTVSLQMGMLGC